MKELRPPEVVADVIGRLSLARSRPQKAIRHPMHRPLGAFESALTLTDDHAPLNVVIVARLVGGPDLEVLRRALAALPLRHPLLGVRIVGADGRYTFSSDSALSPSLDEIPRRDDTTWQDVAEAALARRLDRTTGPLLHATLVSAPDESCRELVLTFHHAIMDATSALHLLGELLATCAGGADELPPLPVLPAADELFPRSARGNRRPLAVLRYAAAQLAAELPHRLRGRLAEAPIPPPARCRIHTLHLPAEATRTLVRRARRERITIASALAAALLLAVARERRSDRVRQNRELALGHLLFASLRSHLEPAIADENLGAYFTMLRFVTLVKPNDDAWSLGRRVQQQTMASLRRGDRFGSALTARPMMRFLIRHEPFRMAATAFSYVGPVPLEPRFGAIELRGLHAFVSSFHLGPEVAAQARIFRGELIWDLLHLESEMGPAEIEAIGAAILASLETAAG